MNSVHFIPVFCSCKIKFSPQLFLGHLVEFHFVKNHKYDRKYDNFIKKYVVDHFVESHLLWRFGMLPMDYYKWIPRPVRVRSG